MINKKLFKRALKSVYPVQKKVQKFFTLTYISKTLHIIGKHIRFKNINVSLKNLIPSLEIGECLKRLIDKMVDRRETVLKSPK